MLKLGGRSFRAGVRIRRSFASKRPHQNVLDTLKSDEPMKAYPLIVEYTKKSQTIPPSVMTRFYEVVRKSQNPLYAHLFANLVSVGNVGPRYFAPNVDRVINLYVLQRNWEMCLDFIREVQYANNGEHVLSYDTLEELLLSAKWHDDVGIATQVVETMRNTYPNVFGRTWGLLAQLSLDTAYYDSLKFIHKHALVPGFLVLDDASYLRLADVAARNGDLRMCEWVALRMRRRQWALQTRNTDDSLQLYIYLIEAAARSSVLSNFDEEYGEISKISNDESNSGPAVSIKAVCRYIVRLGNMASNVSVSDLPQTVEALVKDRANSEYMRELFEVICSDATVCREVKTLIFNILLAAKAKSEETLMSEVTEIVQGAGTAMGIDLNEDSVLCMLDLAIKFNSDKETLHKIAMQCASSRVENKLRRLGF